MDPFIATFAAQPDDDLMLCEADGVAYQADMRTGRVPYSDTYWQKVSAYENGYVANAVNRGRCEMLAFHLKPGASVLDIGAGTGAFVRAANAAGFRASGFDVMPRAIERLKAEGLYDTDVESFDAVTMWDSLEHMESPADWLRRVPRDGWLFLSLPVFKSLSNIRASKHYRPGEHLTYWTAEGLIDWLRHYGFRIACRSNHEIAAGRESIGAFGFRRTH